MPSETNFKTSTSVMREHLPSHTHLYGAFLTINRELLDTILFRERLSHLHSERVFVIQTHTTLPTPFTKESVVVYLIDSHQTIGPDYFCTAVSPKLACTRNHCFTILFSTIETSLYVSSLIVLRSLTKYSNPSSYESQKGLPPLIEDHINLRLLLHTYFL